MHIYVHLFSSTTLRLDAAKGVLYEYILAGAIKDMGIHIHVYMYTYVHIYTPVLFHSAATRRSKGQKEKGLGVLCTHSVRICICVCRHFLQSQLYSYMNMCIYAYIYICMSWRSLRTLCAHLYVCV